MPLFEVETCMLVHTNVRITVEAADKDAALDAVADLLPTNHDPSRARKWSATVTFKPPKGVKLERATAVHFEQTGGGEKVRRRASAQ